jgi:ketol-acid reductoisomerase
MSCDLDSRRLAIEPGDYWLVGASGPERSALSAEFRYPHTLAMTISVFNQRTHPGRFTLAPLTGRTVAIIGYGNQGRAHALCLRDSGVACVVGVRGESTSITTARSDGLPVHPIEEAAAMADIIVMALPDEVHGHVFRESIDPQLRDRATIGFLHGSSVRFGSVAVRPGIGCVLLAPKGPGVTLRALFLEGRGLPALYAMHQDSAAGDAEALTFAWATAIGCGRSGVIATTFADEAETDLFGEQAVLCGGMLGLAVAAFETMVDAGYEPELAYLECCHELKQVADLVYARGPAGMAEAISNTAEFGAYRAGGMLVDDATRARMKEILDTIRSGEFARAIEMDSRNGFQWLNEQRQRLRAHAINPAGEAIRDLMPWLKQVET